MSTEKNTELTTTKPTSASANAEASSAEADAPDSLIDAFDNTLVTLSTLKAQVTSAMQQVRVVKNIALKERRAARKIIQKRKNSQNRAPSGFAKPASISEELRVFMGAKSDEQFARTAITQYIIKYITENKLQNPENRKEIKPDHKLKSLLKLGPTDQLTYFNLQKYMNQHFPDSKSNKAAMQ